MSQSDIRQSFLNFFKSKGHTLVPSDSLVPSSDPTLLFTSAGMVQFKPHFLQQIPLTFHRAASAQRCLRTTDIEQVGITPRHLTLFEMLGNFSFGDYFKTDAIAWAWEFLTKDLNLPKDRLWITVYTDDDEAESIWKKIVPANRIVRMGAETNFWTMGPTGPCGPCSEIHWDFLGDNNTSGPDDSARWMEVWNLVFTQFDRQADGSLVPLPKKNIDTGMGLERLTSVVEGARSNFETSLFKPIIRFGEDHFKYKMGTDERKDIALKIVSDHLRAVTLLAYDGILPSNEGRGYVMRRLLRRAVRQATLFGRKESFLYKGVPIVADLFKSTAEDLLSRKDAIALIIQQEEERFIETIETGSAKLKEMVDLSKKSGKSTISGQDVFRLYETFGFPPEVTKEILAEKGLSFDDAELKKAQTDAQQMAREGWKGSGAQDVTIYNDILKRYGPTKFQGYETLEVSGPITAILKDGKEVSSLHAGEMGEVFTANSPFYPEGGGQVGDKGFLKSTDGETIAMVEDAQKPVTDLTSHIVKAQGELKKGQTVTFAVSKEHREPTKRHHTATHLLHAALRQVLGKTVTQAGSLVAPEKLRFDFSYNKPLTAEEVTRVENIVNDAILQNLKSEPRVVTPDVARSVGAMALFGEKYGSAVRCLVISPKGWDDTTGAFSIELCGGTHVSATGDIGSFKIISDSSLAAGVRRIEAVAGTKTLEYLRSIEHSLYGIADRLKATPAEAEIKISRMLEKQKQLEQEIRDLKLKMAQGGGSTQEAKADVQSVNGINLAVRVHDGLEVKDLRVLADRLKDQIKSGVVFAASTVMDEDREKVSFIFAVTADAQAKGLNAGQMAKAAAAELGGSGGGRADFAQGGGQGKDKLQALLSKIPSFLKSNGH